MKPIAHLLHGFMGSGKTTFARRLERDCRAVRLSHDEWMVRLHGWNPPEEHFRKYWAQEEDLIWDEARRAIGAGTDVILDRSKSPKTDALWIDGAGFEPMQGDDEFVRIDGTE